MLIKHIIVRKSIKVRRRYVILLDDFVNCVKPDMVTYENEKVTVLIFSEIYLYVNHSKSDFLFYYSICEIKSHEYIEMQSRLSPFILNGFVVNFFFANGAGNVFFRAPSDFYLLTDIHQKILTVLKQYTGYKSNEF